MISLCLEINLKVKLATQKHRCFFIKKCNQNLSATCSVLKIFILLITLLVSDHCVTCLENVVFKHFICCNVFPYVNIFNFCSFRLFLNL